MSSAAAAVCTLTLSCILTLPALLQAATLTKLPDKGPSETAVSIDSARAHDFLSRSRARRQADPKWYQKDPDFQSYYRYYSSIGHMEGLYEVDKIRMIYQQMRHLENAYGPDASKYQNILGLRPPKTTPPPATTAPPPPPTTPAPALSKLEVIYLCNPKDPLCKAQVVYVPTGAVPVLCDPRYHPTCNLGKAAKAPPPPTEPVTPAPPPAITPSAPPPPPPIIVKGMEYDCDPYWDPDCLIDNPPRPVKVPAPPPAPTTKAPPAVVVEKKQEDDDEEEEDAAPASEDKSVPETPYLYYDPYDYRRDLYDPHLYANPADNPE